LTGVEVKRKSYRRAGGVKGRAQKIRTFKVGGAAYRK